MRCIQRIAGAALALAPLSYTSAQTAGKNLAMDFRTTVTISGMPDTGVIQGHAIGSGDKMRMDLDLKGPGAQVSPLGGAGGKITMILSDTDLPRFRKQSLSARPAF